jgi:hypothetical protein
MMTLTTRIAVETMFSDELSSAVLQAVFNDFSTILAGIYTRTIVPPPLDKFLIVGNRRFNRARCQHWCSVSLSGEHAAGRAR